MAGYPATCGLWTSRTSLLLPWPIGTSFHGIRLMAIGRRTLFTAGTCAVAVRTIRPAAAALPVPPSGSLAFRLIRHGGEIGRHTLTFGSHGDVLTVHTAVDALVTLISIPIVRYTHRVVETWQGQRLTSLAGETDKNG